MQATDNKQLTIIAHELLEKVRKNVTIDWTVKETVRAKLRAMVRRIFTECGFVDVDGW